MKAPQFSSTVTDVSFMCEVSKPNPILKAESTSTLLKRITQATDKRRVFRKKSRCSNLRAEALLSNLIRMAKSDLARRQEEKRQKLKRFTYQLSVTSQDFSSESTDAEFLCKAQVQSNDLDDQLKSCIASLDSFFESLNRIRA